ncbi:MAG TPA: pyruvate, water dikinase regulatory protein [Pseudobdellovibrionaceae bacterium]|mgnify:CR=1 FL=1|nr:pyruvate, water dikinase regulatory protein [Pseudobdellovibrionaceae bacterium]
MSYTIYILSDSTGETAATIIRAALVQYSKEEIHISRHKNIRTLEQAEPLLEECFQNRGLVAYTIANPVLRSQLHNLSSEKGMPSIDLLGPILSTLDIFFGVSSQNTVGALRVVDEKYYKRIEAIEYTVKHDDGKTLNDLDKADIILVGISRTSKTPLSIFLSHKGWKVANIPLVLDTAPPEKLFEVDQRKIIGLLIDIESLRRIRKIRLEKFGQDPGGEYASLSHISKEIEFAEQLFKQNRRWPVFNVTERALEETASEIVRIVAARMGMPQSVLF